MKNVTSIIWGVLGLSLCATLFYAMHLGANFVRDVKSGVSSTGDFFVELAEGFKRENITETFREELQEIKNTGQGNLEVSLMTSTEHFKRSSSQTAFWDLLDLGTTTTEIQIPATFRYHVKLSDEWKLDVQENECVVIAPKLRASLPVAFNTGRMFKSIDEGWFRFNGYEQMAGLERNISFKLSQAANRNKDLVREQSRKTIREFVKHWLQKNDQWNENAFTNVRVIFADEPKTKLQTY
tara:strand:- start:1050 stop:1766 length:717 start_codon:yes stop_codon:yes gene_type:complete